MFVIDIGVPRNADPAIDALDDVYRYDLDDLAAIAERERGGAPPRAGARRGDRARRSSSASTAGSPRCAPCRRSGSCARASRRSARGELEKALPRLALDDAARDARRGAHARDREQDPARAARAAARGGRARGGDRAPRDHAPAVRARRARCDAPARTSRGGELARRRAIRRSARDARCGSPRARASSRCGRRAMSRARIEQELGRETELVPLTTTGDELRDVSLAKVGGKGLFVKEIEEALLDGRADVAVHSAKDLPGVADAGARVRGVPRARRCARRAGVARACARLDDLPRGARVGTGSVRRARAAAPCCGPISRSCRCAATCRRGSRKLEREALDAVVLACAGLDRLGLADRIAERIDPLRLRARGGAGRARDPGAARRSARRGARGARGSRHRDARRGRARVPGAARRRLQRRRSARTRCSRGGRLALRVRLLEPDGAASIERTLEGDARDAAGARRAARPSRCSPRAARRCSRALRARGATREHGQGDPRRRGAGRAGSDHGARRRRAAPRGRGRVRRAAPRRRCSTSRRRTRCASTSASAVTTRRRARRRRRRRCCSRLAARGPHRRAPEGRRSVRVRPRRRGGERLRRGGHPVRGGAGRVRRSSARSPTRAFPITDRRHGASFAVVTGHKDPTKVTRETRWDLLARAADTLVILMGMRNLDEIVERAARGGPQPRDAVGGGDVGHAARAARGDGAARRARRARAERAGVGAPAVVVVGDVVSLRDALAWYERQPLFGAPRARDARARAGGRAGRGARAGGRRGGARAADPARAARRSRGARRRARSRSPTTTRSCSRARTRCASPRSARAQRGDRARDGRARVVCVGPATAQAALDAGLPGAPRAAGALRRGGRARAAARRAATCADGASSCRAPTSRATCCPTGCARPAREVDAVVAYRNAPAEVDRDWLRGELVAGRLDALTFASPSAARRFCALLDRRRARRRGALHGRGDRPGHRARARGSGSARAGGRAVGDRRGPRRGARARDRRRDQRRRGMTLRYKVVETSSVTDEELERIFNEWTARGWAARRRALRDERRLAPPRDGVRHVRARGGRRRES